MSWPGRTESDVMAGEPGRSVSARAYFRQAVRGHAGLHRHGAGHHADCSAPRVSAQLSELSEPAGGGAGGIPGPGAVGAVPGTGQLAGTASGPSAVAAAAVAA